MHYQPRLIKVVLILQRHLSRGMDVKPFCHRAVVSFLISMFIDG